MSGTPGELVAAGGRAGAALEASLERAASSAVLLVASDFDGTLAPIVTDPSTARAEPGAVESLRALSMLPGTHAAIVSGRGLSDLSARVGHAGAVRLVGSHGGEFDEAFAASLTEEASRLRCQVEAELAAIAAAHAGFRVESKPAGVAFHFREADEAEADLAVEDILNGPARWEGVHVKLGKMVVELSVVAASKGTAIDELRHHVGATCVVFIGDDRTDEDGFRHLRGGDVGIKVGDGPTLARHRVGDVGSVRNLLERLVSLRAAHIGGADGGVCAIESLTMLTDQRTAALVTPDARIVWMCLPRIDSPALFAELVDGPAAGRFAVRPARAGGSPKQAYDGMTFHVRTSWPRLTVTDYLDCSGGRPMQRAGRSELVRTLEGRTRAWIEFAPRPDFGRVPTRLAVVPGGVRLLHTPDPVVLRSPDVAWSIVREGVHDTAVAEVELSGESVTLELRYGTGDLGPGVIDEARRSEQTRRYWSGWASNLDVPEVTGVPGLAEAVGGLVRRSALVLRGLCHGPTGAIVAAPTTSLPEVIGGVRNWDYRYCWPRDASMAARALVRLGSSGEALRLLDWLLGVLDTLPAPDQLRPIYTVGSGQLGVEGELAELSGYAGSRPVRVGNGAAGQLQLDVFGPITELIHELMLAGAPLSSEHWRLTQAMVHAVRARWREPDSGIWEIRGPVRHHVHSRVTCWQTVDLACKLARHLVGDVPEGWTELAGQIRADVLAAGFDAGFGGGGGSFTAAYGSGTVDASVLAVALAGLLPADDPRVAGTVRAVEQHLLRGGTVYRYREDDGLPGDEGGFNLCTGWLIEALCLVGRADDARRLFDEFCRGFGPTGLMPEERDPTTGRGLGNHPQAYSHLALINAALCLSQRSHPAR